MKYVTCSCGKEIKINRYEGNIATYKCSTCRVTVNKILLCPEIDKNNFIKANGYLSYYCNRIKKFVCARICKGCKA